MKTTNNKKSKFLALLLSVMMLSSMGAAFASCVDDSDSSSSSSSSSSAEDSSNDKVDNGSIKNAHFDFTKLSETVKIGTSVTGWTRAVNSATTGSAPSSKSASGVIDTSPKAWEALTQRKNTAVASLVKSDDEANDKTAAATSIKEVLKVWDDLSVADKLAFYQAWEKKHTKLDIDDEFEKIEEGSYESFNIDYDDLFFYEDGENEVAIENPGTPDEDKQATTDDKGNARDTDKQILMIHNNNTIGTAQKYTSSSTVTIPAGSAAQVSVWVKTANLKTVDTNKEEQDAIGKGAFISITQSVGSKSLDSYEVKNIQADNWTEYTFYLKGSSFADTKFSIVLGLGQNGGSDHLGYVNGYAFFDNIQYKEIKQDEYTAAVTENSLTETYLSDEKAAKTVDAYTSDETKFAMNFYKTDAGDLENGWEAANDKITSSVAELTKSNDGAKTNENLKAETDVMASFANKAAIQTQGASNKYLSTVYEKFINDDNGNNHTFLADDQEIVMMLSSKGAAYTWKNAYSFTMDANTDSMAVSFYVKTSDFGAGAGLTITLVDDDNSTAFSAINTAKLEGVTVNGIEDYYDGWQRCYFFVEKGEDLKGTEQEFHLDFNYGVTEVSVSTAKTNFVSGFAAFTGFETLSMSKLEYSCAETGTYAQKYTLVESEEDKATGNAGFDSAANTPSDAFEKGLADPKNYKGVYSDSFYVNPNADNITDNDERRLINQYANAGLLNKEQFIEHYDAIAANADNAAWLNGIANGETDPATIWEQAFGTATQPLLIWNDGGEKSYGYVGTSTTISSTHTAISVRVKTSANAFASVYLVDMNDETRSQMLKIEDKVVYWYDDNGNVLTGDSAKKETKVAFRLDKKTGLYTADSKWEHASKYPGNYANLSAYGSDAEGNLIAAENSATHSYHNKDWNRIVFYKHTDGYYTEANGAGTKVTDFATVTDLAKRYEGGNSVDLSVTDINTNGEWATVTFYVKKGNAAKNYRLEVWSSAKRAGAANPADSYVMFDTNNPGTASSLYDGLLEEYKEDTDNVVSEFESVFSYYDTDKHVRYVEAWDTEKEGNLYKDSFQASAFSSATAYLRHETKNAAEVTTSYNVFADYSLFDATVTAATPETDDDTDTDDDTTDTDEDGLNIFMLISSIAVAGALLIAVGGVATQRIIKAVKKKKASQARVNVVKKSK